MLRELIKKVVQYENLTDEEAETAMNEIMSGNAGEIETSAFLTALSMKGVSSSEIASFAKVMREFSLRVKPDVEELVDVCGTGGDALNTFNISTTAMFVVACEVAVAKHGNRAVTSRCGSADVLEELGVNLDVPVEKIKESIEMIGIGFMFAPYHHPAMKNVMKVRRTLGIKTVFNILGPLTNPAEASSQLMGVYDESLTEKIADVFHLLGANRAMVVHGYPGIDELSTIGKTKVSELKDGEIKTYYVRPDEFGFDKASERDIKGGDPKENAMILRNVLSGEEDRDLRRKREIVVLNAAGGLVVGGVVDDLSGGVELAEEIIESGRAAKKLEEFLKFSKG